MNISKKIYWAIVGCLWVIEAIYLVPMLITGGALDVVDKTVTVLIIQIGIGILMFLRCRGMAGRWKTNIMLWGLYCGCLKNLFISSNGGVYFSYISFIVQNIIVIIVGCRENEADEKSYQDAAEKALHKVEKTELEKAQTREKIIKGAIRVGLFSVAAVLVVIVVIGITKFIDRNDKYEKKIWIVENWQGDSYENNISFRINSIENKNIQGIIATGDIAEPFFFADSYDVPSNIGTFSGEIKDGVAVCEFQDEAGNKGNMEITLIDGECMTAKVSYLEIGEGYEGIAKEGEYTFRPYKLSDVNGFSWEEKNAKEIELKGKYWSKVQFIYGVTEAGNFEDVTYMDSFLIDDNDNILYHFAFDYLVYSKKAYIEVVDENTDGLTDIKFEYYIDGKKFDLEDDVEVEEKILYQMQDGDFYSSEIEDRVNQEESGLRIQRSKQNETIEIQDKNKTYFLKILAMEGFQIVGDSEDTMEIIDMFDDGKNKIAIHYFAPTSGNMDEEYWNLQKWIIKQQSSNGGLNGIILKEICKVQVGDYEVFYLPYYNMVMGDIGRDDYLIWCEVGDNQIFKMVLMHKDCDMTQQTWREVNIEGYIQDVFSELEIK